MATAKTNRPQDIVRKELLVKRVSFLGLAKKAARLHAFMNDTTEFLAMGIRESAKQASSVAEPFFHTFSADYGSPEVQAAIARLVSAGFGVEYQADEKTIKAIPPVGKAAE